MKTCTVWGDMSADSAADQYPMVSVCDDCVAAHAGKEDSLIVSVEGGFDSAYGDECYLCDTHIDDEQQGEDEDEGEE